MFDDLIQYPHMFSCHGRHGCPGVLDTRTCRHSCDLQLECIILDSDFQPGVGGASSLSFALVPEALEPWSAAELFRFAAALRGVDGAQFTRSLFGGGEGLLGLSLTRS